MLEHKGYIGHVQLDSKASIFHGEVINARDEITFQGETVAQLKQAFIDAVEAYLTSCKKRGDSPERPFADKLELHLSPILHKDAFIAAKQAHMGLNDWIIEAIKRECHVVGL